MALDPNIILRGSSINDPNKLIELKTKMEALGQSEQEAQKQNALKQLLGQPRAIDQNTGLPTTNAIKALYGIDPSAAVQLTDKAAQAQANKEKMTKARMDRMGELQGHIDKGQSETVAMYDRLVAGGMSPEMAKQQAQAKWDEVYKPFASSGVMSEEEKANFLASNSTFDPDRFRAGSQYYQEWLQKQKADAAALAKSKAETDLRAAQTSKTAEETRLMPDEMAIKRGGLAVQQANVKLREQELHAPSEDRWDLGTLDGKTVWVNTRTREIKPLEGELSIKGKEARGAAPGSNAAERAAILAEVAEDPGFKDKPKSEQLAEAEKRFRTATGNLWKPENREANVRAVAEYQQPPLTRGMASQQEIEQQFAAIRATNPDYNPAIYRRMEKVLDAFGKGKEAQTVRAINAASQHIEVLEKMVPALENGTFTPLNEAAQRWAKMTGKTAPTSFAAVKEILGTEVEKAVAGGIGTEKDRDAIKATLSEASKAEQLYDVFNKLKDLMGGQAMALKKQYETGVPESARKNIPFEDALLSSTKKALGMAEGGEATSGAPSRAYTSKDSPPDAPGAKWSDKARAWFVPDEERPGKWRYVLKPETK